MLAQVAQAQDKLYWANGEVTEAKIVEILDNVKYKDSRGTTRAFGRENFILLVNRRGDFLVIEELNKMNQKNEAEAREAFLTGVGVPREGNSFDLIIKKSSVEKISPVKVIKADISYESDELVNFKNAKGTLESLNKNVLLCIVYKDGAHKLLTSSMIVADYITEIRTALGEAEKNAPAAPKKTGSVRLTTEQVAEFSGKGLKKVEQFADYLKIIVDKSKPGDEKDQAIDLAMKLFLNNAKIEISSVTRNGSNKMDIRQYLNNLKILRYESVNVSWSQIAYVKDLVEETDGSYSGIISAYQTFEGTKNGGIEYQDVTKKEAKVKLSRYNKQKEGKLEKEWDILIGDIRVVETKLN